MSQKTIMILAGGTGGHVFPALAVAEVWRRQGLNVEWIGTQHGIESRIVPVQGIVLHCLKVRGMRGKGWWSLLKGVVPLCTAWWQSMHLMRRSDVVLALGMGGYVTGPAGVAARIAGKPLVLHEQNAVAGLSNRWLAPLASLVLTGFPGVLPQAGAICVGNPVRLSLQSPLPGRSGDSSTLSVLVLGGSQGAEALNQRVPALVQRFAQEHRSIVVQVQHQCGERHVARTLEAYQSFLGTAQVLPFIDDMAAAYTAADVVICRAGALTVAELSAAGRVAILVPFPFAVDDHQTRNAEFLTQANAAFLCPQQELEQRLPQQLNTLLDAKIRQSMADRAYALAQPQAANTIAHLCLEQI